MTVVTGIGMVQVVVRGCFIVICRGADCVSGAGLQDRRGISFIVREHGKTLGW